MRSRGSNRQFVAEFFVVIIPRPFKSGVEYDRFVQLGTSPSDIAPMHKIGKEIAENSFRVGMHVLGTAGYARKVGGCQRAPQCPIGGRRICSRLI